jgi:SpoIID/LytB domain protein
MSIRSVAARLIVPLVGSGLVAAGLVAVPASAHSSSAAAAAARGGQTYFVPVTRELTLRGRGYGHGHGMSQNGAQGAALAGKSHREILRFYYPGTRMGRTKRNVRVLLTADTTSDVTVKPAKGLRVRDLGAGTTLVVPRYARATAWRVLPKAKARRTSVVQYQNKRGWHRWRTLAGDGQFAADVPLTLVLPDGSTRRYRGALRAASPYRGAKMRDTVNVVHIDDYVRGVIADEMPASWHRQALRAQSVAARTYAANMQQAAGKRYYQICDTTACQVYGGVDAETATTDAAVARTARRILLSNGRPAFTQFSASSGGWTSDGGQSYLPAQRDPWDDWSGNTSHAWTTTISVGSLEAAFPQIGGLETVRVTRRDGNGVWGGRVLQLVLEGSRDTVALTGDDLRWRYGLKSNWFSFEPTPIIATWRALGGRRSMLGEPTSPEVAVRGRTGRGARQLFEKGRAFWTRREGAAAVAGPVLARYRKLGGPASRYGFPRQSVVRTADRRGRRLPLERGMIFWSRRTGAWVLQGRVLLRYRKLHFAAGRLGYPTGNVVDTAKIQRGRFQGGVIVHDKRARTVTVRFT